MKKIRSLLILFFLCLASSFFAQSADVITQIIDSNFASIGQVCYLSAVQQNLVSENASYEEAINALYDNNQIDEIKDSNLIVNYKEISYIFSQIWQINGSLMFRISGGSPFYAFKQFKKDGIFPSSVDPSKVASGTDLLNILTSCISKYGNFDLTSVDMDY